MTMLDILAKVANECKKIPIYDRRINNLIKARARMAQIRAERKQNSQINLDVENKIDWRLINLKKAMEAKAIKHLNRQKIRNRFIKK